MLDDLRGTGAVARLVARRDRVRLPLWVFAVGGITYVAGSQMGRTFPTQASIDAYARTAATSPALVAMSGPPLGLDTLPGIVLNKIEMVTVLGVSLMALLTVVRHTRAEEEEGRTELLRAGVLGRHSGGAAALLLASAASVVLGLVVTLGLVGATVPAGSAVLYGAGTAALGVVVAAATLCLAQLFVHARTVTGVALVMVGAAYVLRAAGDVRGDGLVWFTPIGWSQATHVLGDERWWPLLVCLGAAALLVVGAVRFSGLRDVGAGLVAPRPGRPAAGERLSSAFGLAVRLQRGTVLSWAGGVLALALVEGALSNAVAQMGRDNPTLERYLHATGQGTFVEAFLSTMLLMMALLAAAFAVAAAARLRSEETSDRLEALLATGLSRTRWLVANVVLVAGSAVLLLVLAALGLGAAYAATTGDGTEALRLPGQVLLYAPAVLSVAALAVLVFGWRPAWGGLPWAVLGLSFVLGWLGGLLDLPDWVLKVSPFGLVPLVPMQPASWGAPLATLAAAVLLAVLGWAGFLRRDVR